MRRRINLKRQSNTAFTPLEIRHRRCLPVGFGRLSLTGFTYIEMMITIVIVAICFVPLTRMFTSSISEVAYAGDKLTALNLAREEIEKVKNLNLTEYQLLATGDLIIPSLDNSPIVRNKAYWRIRRIFKKGSNPLELRVEVFREDKVSQKVIELAILIEDLEWSKEE